MMKPEITVVIPSYRREKVLLDTITALMALAPTQKEIVIVDQTPVHQPEVAMRLKSLQEARVISLVHQFEPSIPMAMNKGALEARGILLLYLDDDIIPDHDLLDAHIKAQKEKKGTLVAGRVLQPWHDDEHYSEPFTMRTGELKSEFMGGNFSIKRDKLLELGGFDENFKGAAYRFERAFADRVLDEGGTIWYEPCALIRHLHHSSGGTRSKGDHLTSWNPRHPVGAYYYLFTSNRLERRTRQVFSRLVSSVATRHHLRKPWFIPVTLFSEMTGLVWAAALAIRGPRLPFSSQFHGKVS